MERALNQYLEAADSASLNFPGDMTVEAWVNLATLPKDGETYTIISKWGTLTGPGSDANNTFALWFQKNGGIYQLQIGTDNGAQHLGGFVDCSPNIAEWNHIAVTYHSSLGTADVYANGSFIGTASGLTTSLQSTNIPLLIGQYGEAVAGFTNDGGGFDGLIDDVRIYDAARSQAEIAGDYQRELAGNEQNLIAYWSLDRRLVDVTVNGNNLSAVNFNSRRGYSNNTPF